MLSELFARLQKDGNELRCPKCHSKMQKHWYGRDEFAYVCCGTKYMWTVICR